MATIILERNGTDFVKVFFIKLRDKNISYLKKTLRYNAYLHIDDHNSLEILLKFFISEGYDSFVDGSDKPGNENVSYHGRVRELDKINPLCKDFMMELEKKLHFENKKMLLNNIGIWFLKEAESQQDHRKEGSPQKWGNINVYYYKEGNEAEEFHINIHVLQGERTSNIEDVKNIFHTLQANDCEDISSGLSQELEEFTNKKHTSQLGYSLTAASLADYEKCRWYLSSAFSTIWSRREGSSSSSNAAVTYHRVQGASSIWRTTDVSRDFKPQRTPAYIPKGTRPNRSSTFPSHDINKIADSDSSHNINKITDSDSEWQVVGSSRRPRLKSYSNILSSNIYSPAGREDSEKLEDDSNRRTSSISPR